MSIHSAPPVVYPLGRSRFQAGVLCVVWLSGAALMLAWWRVGGQWGWRLLVGAAAVAVSGGAALWSYRSQPLGQLIWDGQEWRRESPGYQSGTTAFDLAVLADFQVVLLLRLQNQAGARLWLWVGKSSMPERWMDLRRAVYFRPSSRDALPVDPGTGVGHALKAPPSVAVSAYVDSDPRSFNP